MLPKYFAELPRDVNRFANIDTYKTALRVIQITILRYLFLGVWNGTAIDFVCHNATSTIFLRNLEIQEKFPST